MRAHDRSSSKATPSERKKAARRPTPDPYGLLALQRSIGNQAVLRLLQPHPHGEDCGHDAGVQRAAVDAGLLSPSQPLDAATLAEKEEQFQADFSGVRVHTGSVAAAAAAAVEARAFTVHQDIVLGERGDDQELLDHELTHVVRNQQGAAVGHDTGGGFAMTHPNDDAEREAAANAARMRSGGASAVLGQGPSVATAPVASTAGIQRWYTGQADPLLYNGPKAIDNKVPKTPQMESTVDNFVDGLNRPEWYERTRESVIGMYESRSVPDPFSETGQPMLVWQCASCKRGVTYPGIDIGHRVPWQEYLRSKGVQTIAEAKDAYNDVHNLQIECATCNRSHDFERNAAGEWRSGDEESGAHTSDEDFIVSDNASLSHDADGSPRPRSSRSSDRMSVS
jgi:hypothetical protein